MAKLSKNAVMHGASGKIGKLLVYRTMADGETLLSVLPRRKAPATPNELTEREKFRKAAAMAKRRIKDPVLGPQYMKKAKYRQGAYHVALAECLNEMRTGPSKRKRSAKLIVEKPLRQEAYVELARLSVVAVNRMLNQRQAEAFVHQTLSNAQKMGMPNSSLVKKQAEIAGQQVGGSTLYGYRQIDMAYLSHHDKIPRPNG